MFRFVDNRTLENFINGAFRVAVFGALFAPLLIIVWSVLTWSFTGTSWGITFLDAQGNLEPARLIFGCITTAVMTCIGVNILDS